MKKKVKKCNITLSEAIRIVEEEEKNYKVGKAYDAGHSYVFDLIDPTDGEYPDFCPVGVNKVTGESYEYFPPDYDDDICVPLKLPKSSQ